VRLATPLAVLAGFLLFATPASAGTVRYRLVQPAEPPVFGPIGENPKVGGRPEISSLAFAAAPGEANRLVATLEGASLRVRDEGAPLTADGCQQVSESEALCRRASSPFSAFLGDGDDRAYVEEGAVSGGPGSDELAGGPAGQSLLGGEGSDSLAGGPGDDTLYGGDEAPDALDGGPGRDVAAWSEESRPVRADLADPGRDGVAGDDLLAEIEGLTGGRGDDALNGDDGANRLRGGPGRDRLRPGPGRDAVDGEAGDDSLLLAGDGPGDGDLVTCGGGIDATFAPGPLTLAGNPGCERRDPIRDPSGVRYRRGVLRVPVLCPAELGTACLALVRISTRLRSLPREDRAERGRELRVGPGVVRSVQVRLPAALAALARRSDLRLTVDVAWTPDVGCVGECRRVGRLVVRL
jgi:hypothetical protein